MVHRTYRNLIHLPWNGTEHYNVSVCVRKKTKWKGHHICLYLEEHDHTSAPLIHTITSPDKVLALPLHTAHEYCLWVCEWVFVCERDFSSAGPFVGGFFWERICVWIWLIVVMCQVGHFTGFVSLTHIFVRPTHPHTHTHTQSTGHHLFIFFPTKLRRRDVKTLSRLFIDLLMLLCACPEQQLQTADCMTCREKESTTADHVKIERWKRASQEHPVTVSWPLS